MKRSTAALALVLIATLVFSSCNNIFGDYDNPVDPAAYTAYVIETNAYMTDLNAIPDEGVIGRYTERGNIWTGDMYDKTTYIAQFSYSASEWSHQVRRYLTDYRQVFHTGADGNNYLLEPTSGIFQLDSSFLSTSSVLDTVTQGWSFDDIGSWVVDSAGNLYLTLPASRKIVRVAAGTGVPADFYEFSSDVGSPVSIAISPDGEIYVSIFSSYEYGEESDVALYLVESDGSDATRVAFGGSTEWSTPEDIPGYQLAAYLPPLEARVASSCGARPDRIDFDSDGNIFYLTESDGDLLKIDFSDNLCFRVNDGLSYWDGGDDDVYSLAEAYAGFDDFCIDRTTDIIYAIEISQSDRLIALTKNGLDALGP
jgi:DNA-binding beta-propeller fold protein YncE